MTEAAQPIEPEAPAVPTEEELAFTPPEQDPYLPRGKDGKFLPKADDAAKPDEPEKKPEVEAKPEPEKEEERAPKAKEAAGLVKQRKWISQQRAELEKLRAEIDADRREADRLRTLRRENPRAVLDELGLSFRELAEEAARQDGEDPRDKALRELKQELDDLKGFKKSLSEEREAQKQEQGYQADVGAVTERINVDADAYPFLAAYGSEKAAAHAVRTFYAQQQGGSTPDLYEILEGLEQELASDYERLTQAQQKRNQSATPAAQAGSPERVNGSGNAGKARGAQTGATPPATLTNRTATERASPDRKLSNEERRRQAASRIVIRD